MRNATALAVLFAAGWRNEVSYDFATLMLWRAADAVPCGFVPWDSSFFAQWVDGAVLVSNAAGQAVPLADLDLPPIAARAVASYLFDLTTQSAMDPRGSSCR